MNLMLNAQIPKRHTFESIQILGFSIHKVKQITVTFALGPRWTGVFPTFGGPVPTFGTFGVVQFLAMLFAGGAGGVGDQVQTFVVGAIDVIDGTGVLQFHGTAVGVFTKSDHGHAGGDVGFTIEEIVFFMVARTFGPQLNGVLVPVCLPVCIGGRRRHGHFHAVGVGPITAVVVVVVDL